MAEAPSNTHNKRSLIRTSHVCHRRRGAGRNQQVEEYKQTNTHTHTHTHKQLLSLLQCKYGTMDRSGKKKLALFDFPFQENSIEENINIK